jgi:hypothetical protein
MPFVNAMPLVLLFLGENSLEEEGIDSYSTIIAVPAVLLRWPPSPPFLGIPLLHPPPRPCDDCTHRERVSEREGGREGGREGRREREREKEREVLLTIKK